MAGIHLLIFSLLTLTLTSRPTLSLYIHPPHNNPNFDANISVSGDAEIVDGSIQLTRPIPSSSGLLVNTKPFNFLKPTSFSTDFSFSISPHSGLALLLFPTHFPRKLPPQDLLNSSFAIQFDTSMEEDVVSVRVSNVSSSLNLNSGVKVKLHAWVDYEASSKRGEVRLTEMGSARPYNPLIAFPIDLAKMWKGEEVLVGISSSSGNSQQTSSVFSWKFRVRVVPHWMHSQPLDPVMYADKGSEKRKEHKKSSCPLRIVNGLLLGMACGALAAFVMLLLWTITVNRRNVIPSEYLKHPVGFGYEKVSVVVENGSENVKN